MNDGTYHERDDPRDENKYSLKTYVLKMNPQNFVTDCLRGVREKKESEMTPTVSS